MTFAGPRYVADGTFWYDLLEDMELDVRVQHPEDPSASSNTIRLERSLSSLGAVRFWFRCPLSDRRVAKLYLPPGSGVFGHRGSFADMSARMVSSALLAWARRR